MRVKSTPAKGWITDVASGEINDFSNECNFLFYKFILCISRENQYCLDNLKNSVSVKPLKLLNLWGTTYAIVNKSKIIECI